MAKTWLIVGVTLLVALVVGAVAIAVVTMRGGERLLAADSPEGVVQRYLLALRREDYQEAHSYLSSYLQTRCPLDRFVSDYYWPYADEDQQVTLEKTQRYDDSAVVRVTCWSSSA